MDTRVYCRKTIGEVPANTSILSDGKYKWLSIEITYYTTNRYYW